MLEAALTVFTAITQPMAIEVMYTQRLLEELQSSGFANTFEYGLQVMIAGIESSLQPA